MNLQTDNRASTATQKKIDAVKSFGIPSRVRADKGSEFNHVETFMNSLNGLDRGSMIQGKSTHNRRIERMWRDIYEQVTSTYYDLFYFIKGQNLLDINANQDMQRQTS